MPLPTPEGPEMTTGRWSIPHYGGGLALAILAACRCCLNCGGDEDGGVTLSWGMAGQRDREHRRRRATGEKRTGGHCSGGAKRKTRKEDGGKGSRERGREEAHRHGNADHKKGKRLGRRIRSRGAVFSEGSTRYLDSRHQWSRLIPGDAVPAAVAISNSKKSFYPSNFFLSLFIYLFLISQGYFST